MTQAALYNMSPPVSCCYKICCIPRNPHRKGTILAFVIFILLPLTQWKEISSGGTQQTSTVCTHCRHRWKLSATLQRVLFFPFSTQAYWPFLPWADPTLLWDGHKVTNVGQAIKTSCWAKRLKPEGSSLPFYLTCKPSSPILSQHTQNDRGLLFVHVSVVQCGQSIASGYENLQWSCQRLDAGEASDTLIPSDEDSRKNVRPKTAFKKKLNKSSESTLQICFISHFFAWVW